MNTENMIKYVEALESGNYPQDPNGGNLKTPFGYCCLGVLEEVKGSEWMDDPHCNRSCLKATGEGALPPRETITEFLGIPNGWIIPQDPHGTIKVTTDEGDEIGVHALNDRGVPFPEIARLIRKTYGLPPAT